MENLLPIQGVVLKLKVRNSSRLIIISLQKKTVILSVVHKNT